jgi:arylsulfatase A-like enzyme
MSSNLDRVRGFTSLVGLVVGCRLGLGLLWVGWVVVAGCGPVGDTDERPVGGGPAAGRAGSVVQNVIVVALDTLRSDRREVYGYGRPTSPNLAALARRSVVFDRVQAQSAQTAPSHASLFTSEYVGAHGVRNVHGGSSEMRKLPPGVRTLAEVAAGAGWETAAFVSGGNLTRGMDMHRGFSAWDERNEDASLRIDRLLEWIEAPGRGRFLALLHTYQTHAPYLPPAELVPEFTDPAYQGPLRPRLERYLGLSQQEAWAGAVGPDYWEGMLEYSDEDVRFLSDLYDAEIAYLDAQVRRIMEVALIGERARDTLLVVVSDHGEEFRDHGKFQHDQVYQELVNVPLIMRLPTDLEREGWTGRVATPVELIDVAPTIVELLGLPVPEDWSGRSLVPVMRPSTRDGALDADRAVYCELTLDPGPKTYRSVLWDGWKYIHARQLDLEVEWEWLFDLDADPGERRNLVDSASDDVQSRLGLLRELVARRTAEDGARRNELGEAGLELLDEAIRRELEQLGYMGGGR